MSINIGDKIKIREVNNTCQWYHDNIMVVKKIDFDDIITTDYNLGNWRNGKKIADNFEILMYYCRPLTFSEIRKEKIKELLNEII